MTLPVGTGRATIEQGAITMWWTGWPTAGRASSDVCP
jgi:hypothetical protein